MYFYCNIYILGVVWHGPCSKSSRMFDVLQQTDFLFTPEFVSHKKGNKESISQ